MITTLTPGDLPQVMALEQACFPAAEQWSEALWRDELAANDREVLGWRAAPGLIAAASVRQMHEIADLHRVLVAPGFRRRGIALHLVTAGARWAMNRGAEQFMLEVNADNEPAKKLYERLGFEVLEVRRDYYGAGHDAITMRARLPLTTSSPSGPAGIPLGES